MTNIVHVPCFRCELFGISNEYFILRLRDFLGNKSNMQSDGSTKIPSDQVWT